LKGRRSLYSGARARWALALAIIALGVDAPAHADPATCDEMQKSADALAADAARGGPDAKKLHADAWRALCWLLRSSAAGSLRNNVVARVSSLHRRSRGSTSSSMSADHHYRRAA
jgi:hypothetical protein